jgi:hypothetical protein
MAGATKTPSQQCQVLGGELSSSHHSKGPGVAHAMRPAFRRRL